MTSTVGAVREPPLRPRHLSMRYDGPIYRPPSEADSLLVQATVGCPHNLCTFCMVYKDGVKFKVRPVSEIKADLIDAAATYGARVRTLFFPAGNTIAMPTAALAAICRYSYTFFPRLERITVYGSSQYIHRKGPDQLQTLAQAGLGRIHVGVESGDDVILTRIKKGATAQDHIRAGHMARAADLKINAYVMVGIGGQDRSETHARETARVISDMHPAVVRLRTFVPKVNTPLLADVQAGRFQMLSPHQALTETMTLLSQITTPTQVTSDHYTNYLDINGRLPEDRDAMLEALRRALCQDESTFRPFFIGTQ
ncbi:MAG: radical SAM protein [Deltaproteobacteria bacterium]|nr:radical SAM protein [Deltaproteobacteria bacterium]